MPSTINADNGVSSGSAGLKSAADSSGVLQLQTNGTTAVTVDTSQNVGIGTTSPGSTWTAKMAVVGSVASGGQNYSAAFTDGINTALRIGHQTNLTNLVNDGALALYTASTERMRLDSSGNVGIGTSSPASRLDVQGANAAATGISSALTLRQASDGGVSLNFVNGVTTNANPLASIRALVESSGAGTDDGVLSFSTATNAATSERMRIDSSGNLTISSGKIVSNASPSTPTLDVAGNTLTYANNATVDFPLFSGMIIVNTQTSGDVSVYLCGAGSVSRIGTSTGTSTGTVTFVSGIGGYRWTNNSGGSVVASFASIRTRAFA